MNDVRRCDEHGYHEGESCPICDATGSPVLAADRRRRLSKFVSGALRHFPDDAGLELDERGWTDLDAVVAAVESRYSWADRDALLGVVATDPKGRFEVDDDSIRAAYGHSVDVDLDAGDGPVPDELYHGTAPSSLDAILREGIRPMSRQLVHLSASVEEARAVGRRHADEPAVLSVDADGMAADGHRVTRRGEAVYTTERVPPAYLRVVERP